MMWRRKDKKSKSSAGASSSAPGRVQFVNAVTESSRGKKFPQTGPPQLQIPVYKDSKIPGHLIGVIADEDTCVGFLMGGIGEVDKNHHPNYFVVEKNTASIDIELSFRRFLMRKDVDLLLITQDVADRIRYALDRHTKLLPVIVEIPSSHAPYNPEIDPIILKARQLGGAGN